MTLKLLEKVAALSHGGTLIEMLAHVGKVSFEQLVYIRPSSVIPDCSPSVNRTTGIRVGESKTPPTSDLLFAKHNILPGSVTHINTGYI